MFKESRRKIVVAIMSVLVILWVGTLGVTDPNFQVAGNEINSTNREARLSCFFHNFPDFFPNGRKWYFFVVF